MGEDEGRLIDIGDTELFVVERGDGHPLIVLHGGPGLDHHTFGDYLDGLTDQARLILIDQRANGRSARPPEETWTLKQHARDVHLLASAMGLEHYSVLGHSYGAFAALQHAVDYSGEPDHSVISSGVPGSRFLMMYVDEQLENFEPLELRQQVTESWAREQHAQTQEDVASLLADQMPFHFADPYDARIAEFAERTKGTVYSPEILRKLSNEEYGGIEVEDQLGDISHTVLILVGRHDRTCSIEAAEFMAANIPHAKMVIFEHSAHMTYVEENEKYVSSVRAFLSSKSASE